MLIKIKIKIKIKQLVNNIKKSIQQLFFIFVKYCYIFKIYFKYTPKNKVLLMDTIYVNNNLNNQKILQLIDIIIDKNIDTIHYIDINNYINNISQIKYYFPNIKINLFLYDLDMINLIYLNYLNYLNYASQIFVKDLKMKNVLDDLIYINKPVIKISKIITFGTFDLFHLGHKNIIDKCKQLSDNITIGISSDDLNMKKGKCAHDLDTIRIDNIKKYIPTARVFYELSLEEKDNYIKEHHCNILIMGDDWENKFNWVSCDVIYFPRTPNISSTQLRSELCNREKTI